MENKYYRGIDSYHPGNVQTSGVMINMQAIPKCDGLDVINLMKEIGIMFYDKQVKDPTPVMIYSGRGGQRMFKRMLKSYLVYHRLMKNYKPRHFNRRFKRPEKVFLHSK